MAAGRAVRIWSMLNWHWNFHGITGQIQDFIIFGYRPNRMLVFSYH